MQNKVRCLKRKRKNVETGRLQNVNPDIARNHSVSSLRFPFHWRWGRVVLWHFTDSLLLILLVISCTAAYLCRIRGKHHILVNLNVCKHSLSMGTPLTNQLIFGFGLPLTRQVRIPVSLGARIRFLGALIQNGAAGKTKNIRCVFGENLTEKSFASQINRADLAFFPQMWDHKTTNWAMNFEYISY